MNQEKFEFFILKSFEVKRLLNQTEGRGYLKRNVQRNAINETDRRNEIDRSRQKVPK